MQKEVELKKIITITPSCMNHNIIKTVYHLLKSKYEKNCNEDDGMIISIGDVSDIQNVISKDSVQIHFMITFKANVVKPQKGDNVSFVPTLIINKGIFGKVYDTINLFIPENNMKGWTYDDNEECFVKKDQKINKKSNVDAIITDTKFTVTKYNCICSL